jgi:septum formation protein
MNPEFTLAAANNHNSLRCKGFQKASMYPLSTSAFFVTPFAANSYDSSSAPNAKSGMKIVLASQSPRRKELLKEIVADFIVVPSKVDENKLAQNDPLQFVYAAACAKAKDVGQSYPNDLVIGADTIVVLAGIIFGKPKNYSDAKKILRKLSGTTHQVITAFALYNKNKGKLLTGHDTTNVTFYCLTEKQIKEYLKQGEYSDKAGSYAVQKVGNKFIRKIDGDYNNVVGFPLAKIKTAINNFLPKTRSIS